MSVFIALGANLSGPAGSPRETLAAALQKLEAAQVRVIRRSRWYRSPAWPDPNEPEFVNAVAEVAPQGDAAALMALLHRIEESLGRVRGKPNAPRVIDLDLLDFRGAVEGGAGGRPILPHPRLHRRAFVLRPLAEIAPDWRHPVSRRSVAELIAELPEEARAEPAE